MKQWFTVEQIDLETYAISEYQHWENVHSYLVLGSKKAALIDTGLGVSSIETVVNCLTSLPVEVLTTHAHWDHIGGHAAFDAIHIHEYERDWLQKEFPLSLAAVKSFLIKEPCVFPDSFDLNGYEIYRGVPKHLLKDGDSIYLGERVLKVIHTPGHSPGHICLYEKDRGYLFTGDLAYMGTLDAYYPTTDPVCFLNSILKLRGLPIGKILPGHHSLTVPVNLVAEIAEALFTLKKNGTLTHGAGIFTFLHFSIHL